MKIVIVDDDILVSSALKTILEAGGEVEVTGTGAPAGAAGPGRWRRRAGPCRRWQGRAPAATGLPPRRAAPAGIPAPPNGPCRRSGSLRAHRGRKGHAHRRRDRGRRSPRCAGSVCNRDRPKRLRKDRQRHGRRRRSRRP